MLDRLRTLIDRPAAAGDRRGFSGADGAGVVVIAADGKILSLSPSTHSLIRNAGDALTLQALFAPADQAEVDRAVRARAVSRLSAEARRPDGAWGSFDLLFERRADGGAAVLLLPKDAAPRTTPPAADDAAAVEAGLADLCHDMRAPLNAVIGFAETMRQETFGPLGAPKYKEYADHIRASGRHLLDLVNAILDLARAGEGRLKLNRTLEDPAAIAREVAAIMRGPAEAAGLSFRVRIGDAIPASWIDARAVRQLLINLLSNAVKFTSDGEILFAARAEGEEIVFLVRDDGVGMSKDALAKVGARFTAAHGAGVRGEGGAGLGLSLAIAYAELHGGRIDLASAPGEGLSAEVRLPVRAAPSARARIAAAPTAAAAAPAAPPEIVSQLERIEAYRRSQAKTAA